MMGHDPAGGRLPQARQPPDRENFKLDRFRPDDGHFEYSTVTASKSLTPDALWDLMAGRGAQEKIVAGLELEMATRDFSNGRPLASSRMMKGVKELRTSVATPSSS